MLQIKQKLFCYYYPSKAFFKNLSAKYFKFKVRVYDISIKIKICHLNVLICHPIKIKDKIIINNFKTIVQIVHPDM